MKAARFERYGDPAEVLQLADVDDPGMPGPGEVRLRMLAAPINPADLLLIAGLYGERPALPHIAGLEGVARVEAAGAGVTELSEGTLVLPLEPSAWQQYRRVRAEAVVPLPEGIDIEQAAMLKVNPATAELMLREVVELEAGEWVAQNAANSAVGRFLVQLARLRGLRTLNIVRRSEASAPLEALGADAVVVDEGDEPPSALSERAAALTAGAPIRLGLDAVGGPATGRLAGLLSNDAVLANYGVLSGAECRVSPADLIFRGLTVRGFWVSRWFAEADPAAIATLFERLAGLVAQGELATAVTARYPLEELGRAVVHAGQGERDGKVLLKLAE